MRAAKDPPEKRKRRYPVRILGVLFIAVLLAAGVLLVLGGTAAAPFIYTLF